ncbi:MAG: thermonuclease family protein [Sutterellaceae bacterium]|nr:thermonuclease family protein [Sutterellaceae bacterium]
MQFKATVVKVYDGDAILVQRDTGHQIKLRILAIDAPERRQAYGGQAHAYLQERLLGKEVMVESIETDAYQRWVSRVYLDGLDIGQEMITVGLAWPYFKFFDRLTAAEQSMYRKAHKKAKARRLGLWADGKAVAPWTWRYEQRILRATELQEQSQEELQDDVERERQNASLWSRIKSFFS